MNAPKRKPSTDCHEHRSLAASLGCAAIWRKCRAGPNSIWRRYGLYRAHLPLSNVEERPHAPRVKGSWLNADIGTIRN